jgi:hypothetical protein
VTQLGKASPGYQADISGTDHCHAHFDVFPSWLSGVAAAALAPQSRLQRRSRHPELAARCGRRAAAQRAVWSIQGLVAAGGGEVRAAAPPGRRNPTVPGGPIAHALIVEGC